MKKPVLVCVALVGVAAMMLPDVAYACEKCFGAVADSDTVRGISLAMLSLLGMVGLVWIGIGMFFINMRKRSKMLEPGDLIVTTRGEIRPSPHDAPEC
ncbi:MAG: hypothetical protein ACE5G0_04105 [Rhodothermales bacterium]